MAKQEREPKLTESDDEILDKIWDRVVAPADDEALSDEEDEE